MRYIIAINTGDYWNVRGSRAEADATLYWLLKDGIVTEDDEPEIIDLDEEE